MADEQTKQVNETPAPAPAAPAASAGSALQSLAIPGAIVIAGLLVALAIIFTGSGSPGTSTQPGTTADTSGPSQADMLAITKIRSDDHVRGNRNADVYIVEYSDTECPFCKQFHGTLKQIMTDYGDRIAWVYRHFPLEALHSKAPREAEALECANELGGPDVFWEYTDRIYELTPSNNGLPDSKLPEIASEFGLDQDKFLECLNSGRYTEKVQNDFNDAVATGGRGTPHPLIVTKDKVVPINGAQPYSVVKSMLDSALGN